jgi:hypothetical protein
LRSDFPNNLPVLQPKESDALCYSFILTTVCQALTTRLQAEGSCHGCQYGYHDFKNLTPNAFLFVFHFFDL